MIVAGQESRRHRQAVCFEPGGLWESVRAATGSPPHALADGRLMRKPSCASRSISRRIFACTQTAMSRSRRSRRERADAPAAAELFARRGGADRISSHCSACHGSRSHLRIRYCQVVALRGAQYLEFAANFRLVQTLARAAWIHILFSGVVKLAGAFGVATVARGSGEGPGRFSKTRTSSSTAIAPRPFRSTTMATASSIRFSTI